MPTDILKPIAVSLAFSLLITTSAATAHCGGCDLGAVQLLETTKSQSSGIVSESLWGNLILSMAYQRDPQLRKLTKRQGAANLVTLGSVGAISGLSLAQNVVLLNPGGAHGAEQVAGVGEEAEGDEHAHAEGEHKESSVPAILGIIASGGTMLALVSQVYLNHRYRKKIKERQTVILKRVEEVLLHLESDLHCMDCQKELSDIIGERAAKEFMLIWRSSHTLASTGSSG